MIVPILALALQAGGVSVIYTGVPSSSGSSVSLVTHDAKTTFTKTTAITDSLSYMKNTSNQSASITVKIPVNGDDIGWGMSDQVQVSATLDNAPVSLIKLPATHVPTDDPHKKASGVVDSSYSDAYTLQMNFIGRGAHSLRVHVITPLGHGGLDGALRVFAYSTTGAGTWSGPVGQLNVSLKYTTRTVFQINNTLPEGKWETGPTGAFIKFLNAAPQGPAKVMFDYYPGGFDKPGIG